MRSRVATELSRLAAPALVAGMTFAGASAVMSAPASAAGACTGTSGVTVVVDYPNGTAVGCAPGSPGTALNALRAAGFATTGTREYGDAFLCSINSFPVAGVCPVTPSGDHTWFVFSAKRGGSWAFANVGVTQLAAPAGSVIGFHYGTSTPPRTAVPAAVSTPKPTPKPTTKPSSKPSTTAPRPTTKPSSKPTAAKPSAKPSTATPKPSPAKPSASSKAASTSHPSASSHAAPSSHGASPTSAPASTSAPTSGAPGQGAAGNVTVKATKQVTTNGKKQTVVTFSDGSSKTVDPNSNDAKKYRVGAPKDDAKASASALPSTSVAQPSRSAAPSISTSGSVPAMPAPEAKSAGGKNNLPGILAGVGVLGVAGIGAGVAAARRRG